MYRMLSVVCLVVVSLSFAGCGSSEDALVENQIRDMNAMADALESDASQQEIAAIEARMKENEKALEALDLSKEQQEALMEKHQDEIEKASKRMMEAMMKSVEEEFAKLDQEISNLDEFEGFEGLPTE